MSRYAETSREAYEHLLHSGALNESRTECMRFCWENYFSQSPMQDISRPELEHDYPGDTKVKTTIGRRLGELCDTGVFSWHRIRPSRLTQQPVQVALPTRLTVPLDIARPPRAYYVALRDPFSVFPGKFATWAETCAFANEIRQDEGHVRMNFVALVVQQNWEISERSIWRRVNRQD